MFHREYNNYPMSGRNFNVFIFLFPLSVTLHLIILCVQIERIVRVPICLSLLTVHSITTKTAHVYYMCLFLPPFFSLFFLLLFPGLELLVVSWAQGLFPGAPWVLLVHLAYGTPVRNLFFEIFIIIFTYQRHKYSSHTYIYACAVHGRTHLRCDKNFFLTVIMNIFLHLFSCVLI